MTDENRSKEDLINELQWLRQKLAQLEAGQDQAVSSSKGINPVFHANTSETALHWETLSPTLMAWVDANAYPAADGGLSIYFRDITERKRMENMLRESEERQRLLLDMMDQAVVIIEKVESSPEEPSDYRYISTNTAFEDQTGFHNVVGKRVREVFPGVEQRTMDMYDDVLRTRQRVQFEAYVSVLDQWFQVESFPMPAPAQLAIVHNDITERKRNEWRQEYLLKLSDTLRLLSDAQAIQDTAAQLLANHLGASQANYTEYREDHSVVTRESQNDPTINIVGSYRLSDFPVTMDILNSGKDLVIPNIAVFPEFSEEERSIYLGLNIYANFSVPLIKEGKLVATLTVRQTTPREWTPVEMGLIHETADRTWASVERASAEAELKKTLDHLEEKVVERTIELHKERQRLFDVLETLHVNICLLTPDCHIFFANRAFRETFGESEGRPCYDYICGLDEPCECCQAYRVLETGQPQHWLFPGSDGSIFDVYDYPFTDVDGKMLILEMNMNITERKRAEEALLQSEERFSKVFYNSPDAIAIIRMSDNRYVDINQKFLDLTEYSSEEVLGSTPEQLDLWAESPNYTETLLRKVKEKGGLGNIEFKIRNKSGKIVTVLSSTVMMSLNNELCRIALMRDVTKERQMESGIERLDRLNLIGEMAASIGHEIRNPMTAIRGFLQMLSSKDCYAEDQIFFDLMIEELDRANGIITEYLGMAKNKQIDLRLQPIDDIVVSLLPMIQADANNKEMDVRLELGKPPMTLVDANEIRQLILNMARNAIDAMSQRGTITIGTKFEEGDIVLFIRDQGNGLAHELIDKLGTPFLTTKDNGTGLGLAVCFGIAARHNARIDYDTGPEGTTFYIKFPMPVEQVLLF